MSQFEYKQFYERNRPHIHPPGAVLFVTFRLADSIPKSTVREYRAKKKWLENELERIGREQKENPSEAARRQSERLLEFQRSWFKKFEDILHQEKHGKMWLGKPEIRQIIFDKLLEDDGKNYRLDAFSIMSNHVHIVFKPNLSEANLREDKTSKRPKFVSEEATLAQIMQSIKGVTARKANLFLKRSGSFWETESYDRFVRDEAEFYRVIKYTLNNPVKAKLVNNWEDWAGNYLAKRLSAKVRQT